MANYSLRSARGFRPVADLSQLLPASAGEYEAVAQRRDADGSMVDRALEIVEKFIIERELILFGGLAIDCALRLKGDRIYPDDQRPDYDFLSPRSVDDAYDLADILRRAGFAGVGAVRGIHVQTMRVRADEVWVADVGYAPPDVFESIPTFYYGKMRVVHPDFQRMDLHLAFCFPFSGAPREDVFHRWAKDIKRFNLFEKYYPVPASPASLSLPKKTVACRVGVPVVGRAQELRVAVHGFAAYAAIRKALDELAAALGTSVSISAPDLKLSFPDDYSVAVEMPDGLSNKKLAFASPWPEEVAPAGVLHAPYMDVYPESLHTDNAVVLSVKGRMLAACTVAAGPAAGPAAKQVRVVSCQYLLLWFLMEAHRADDSDADIYRSYYRYLLDIISAAESLYASLAETVSPDIEKSFAESPFAPVITTIGNVNHNASYIIRMASNAERLRDKPPASLGLDPDLSSYLTGLPANYYPDTAKTRPVFDYSACPLFKRSGEKLT